MPDKMYLDSSCIIVKHEAMTMSLVGGEAKKKKKHANLGYKATKHSERTFLTKFWNLILALESTTLPRESKSPAGA